MKNAILVSGRHGSGKALLASKIKRTFKRAGFLGPERPRPSWLAPGTDVVLVENVASLDQLEVFLRFIRAGAVRVHKKGRPPFEVSPFFIFTSEQVRLLPHYLSRHIGHVDCYSGGMCMVNIYDLPEKVVAAVHCQAEKLGRKRLPGLKKGGLIKIPEKLTNVTIG